jgi:hypothetical protein
MSLFLDWYTDGWFAQVGQVVLGVLILVLVNNGARKCKPLRGLLSWAMLWHLVVFGYYIFWVVPYYGNVADARGYHEQGMEIAQLIRSGQWGSIQWGLSTVATNVLTGFIYSIFGVDAFGISFLSSTMGFAALVYFCRAFSLFTPSAQARKYSAIILFMPSIALWTGLFGKDSWIALGLGLAAYGYSLMHKSANSRGIGHLVLGFVLTGVVRPHIALALAVSMTTAYMWGLTQNTRGSLPMKLLRVAALLLIVGALYPVTMKFVGLRGELNADNMEEYMRTNGELNARAGGSVVNVQAAPGILGVVEAFPRVAIRVILQPFPWEVTNLNSALAALENLFIGWLILPYFRHFRGLFREMSKEPYILFSGILSLAILAMFTFVPNLGLLSRQRVQLLPFLFAVLVAAETRYGRRRIVAVRTILHPGTSVTTERQTVA